MDYYLTQLQTQTQLTQATLAQSLNEWLPILIALITFIGFLYKVYDKIKETIYEIKNELKDAIHVFSHKIESSEKERHQLFDITTELRQNQHNHEIRITKLEHTGSRDQEWKN